MHDGEHSRKAGTETANGLGREGDLGDQHNGPSSLRQNMPHRPQIDLGLAATGHALKQKGVSARMLQILGDGS